MQSKTEVIQEIRNRLLSEEDEYIRNRVNDLLTNGDGMTTFYKLTMVKGRVTSAVYRQWLNREQQKGNLVFKRVDGVECIVKPEQICGGV